MDGFLSNNVRDALVLFGLALSLLQSLALLRQWLSEKPRKGVARVRLGLLEMADNHVELSSEDKRAVRIAVGVSCLVVLVGSVLLTSDIISNEVIRDVVRGILLLLSIVIAVFHEAALIGMTITYISRRVATVNRGRLAAVVGISLLILLMLSYRILSSSEELGGSSVFDSWLSWLVALYAWAYLLTFFVLGMGEVVWQVDEWWEGRGKRL